MEMQLNNMPCGFVSITGQGIIVYANAAFLEMVGYSFEEVEMKHIDSLMTIANKFLFHSYFCPFIKLHGKVEEVYLTLTGKSGREVPVLVNGGRADSEETDLINCVFVQINKRINYEQELRLAKTKMEKAYQEKNEALAKLEKLHREVENKQTKLLELNKKLKNQATTDILTGLKNRRYFLGKLDENLKLFQRYKSPFSLLIIDIDYFKKINDTLGHLAGDRILAELAGIIKAVSRELDIVARYGGEEFTIIYPHTNASEAGQGAERLRAEVAKASWSGYPVTVSIGIATCEYDDTDMTMIAKADQALYASKSRGRNCITHARELRVDCNS